MSAPARRRSGPDAARACAGNVLEYFDAYAYATFSLYFAPVLFPPDELATQLLAAASVVVVALLARPLGAWWLGTLADRRGRCHALNVSIALMSVGALLVALTPSYAAIGLGAPALLVVARILQGLSAGGEFGAGAAYLCEIAPPGRRGLYSGLFGSSIVLGQILTLALLVGLDRVLGEEAMAAWGWRVPFLLGAAGGLVAARQRRRMVESEPFRRTGERGPRVSPWARLGPHRRSLATAVALAVGGTVAYNTLTVYLQKHLVTTTGFTPATASTVMLGGLVFLALCQPLAGHLSDRVGRRAVLAVFAVCGSLFTVPFMGGLATSGGPTAALLLVMGAAAVVSTYSATSAVVKSELFPTPVRALGVGMAQAGAAVFGSSTEPLALALGAAGLGVLFPWYVAGCIAISGLALLSVPARARRSEL